MAWTVFVLVRCNISLLKSIVSAGWVIEQRYSRQKCIQAVSTPSKGRAMYARRDDLVSRGSP